MTEAASSRLERLLGFLQGDPANLRLISDACEAALDEGRLAEAERLLDLFAQSTPLTPFMLNLAGLLALRQQRFSDAAEIFGSLVRDHPDDPGLAYNLAFAGLMSGRPEAAAEGLSEAVVAKIPAAAALKVQALHMRGDLEHALEWGRRWEAQLGDDPALMSALAVVAVDLELTDVARDYAKRAGRTHEGLSSLGALELAEGRLESAATLFDEALKARSDSARALVGKGLVTMNQGDPAAASAFLRRGAEIFGDHLGSWISVGWAELASGDRASARRTFEHALQLDDTFAESHGALAVLDVMEGDLKQAEARTEIAMRLDPRCFSGALAKSLLKAASGDEAGAERIRQIALNASVGPDGQTLGQAMALLLRRRPS